MHTQIAKLALEDGTVFTGRPFGHPGEAAGEAVFNTSMTGYQEILTDPSYAGQVVAMTYPLIGNYGVTAEDAESARPQVAGFVVRQWTRSPSNYRGELTLDEYLKEHRVVGLEGIDTRALVRRTRSAGAMRCVVSATDLDDASLVAKARAGRAMAGSDLASGVLPAESFAWRGGACHELAGDVLPARDAGPLVVALDYGMKWNIPRCLTQVGCSVTVMPGSASAADVLAAKPAGVFVSNGPGDPAAVGYGVEALRGLVGRVPIFGICLGHQLLAQALGAKTFKLKFGHRGANQPVINEETGRVEITTQNHGFAVDADSLPGNAAVTHRNLNDGTVEGLRHKAEPVFSVQYHPEASAGPHDSSYLFEQFRDMMG